MKREWNKEGEWEGGREREMEGVSWGERREAEGEGWIRREREIPGARGREPQAKRGREG